MQCLIMSDTNKDETELPDPAEYAELMKIWRKQAKK
jgi:hypothetical protein